MASPLADLDELVLKCRDEKSKQYIREAVSCYKAGAFRSAIVSTWIAVTFDIIDKIKELALSGDKEAENQLEIFEKARRQNDITSALKFERELLGIAKDKLELISHIECLDLERLKQDRDRCAHPSMTSEGEIFNPPAELARVHIRNAVEYLLQYPPAQGKYALDKLLAEVDSEYFPITTKQAEVAFKKSPLFKARYSLVRNFIIILLKKLISNLNVDKFKEIQKYICALQATEIMYKDIYDDVLNKKLSDLLREIKDNEMDKIELIIITYREIWNYIDNDVQQKIAQYIQNLPSRDIGSLGTFLNFKPLQIQAKQRLREINQIDLLNQVCGFDLHPLVADRSIDLYLTSNSYDAANRCSKFIIENYNDYSLEQIERIIKGIVTNEQIKGSFEVGSVIYKLKQNKKLDPDTFDKLLKENDLYQHISSRDDKDDF
ncbi:hypothetical protein [Pseudanabaena yagii]|uniref:Uncharacterized protein n=1 Tax=Pseudanabaena yagii GIHE-NHR1 TaxID=2722753 RepID=A0ABX1LKQ6_9CYAN|nr:hypothetical protein [Pseudanabaena yagii]NMF56690.1 hypothetical protein [Pseudanabaena yagii GIHE-NHR1]